MVEINRREGKYHERQRQEEEWEGANSYYRQIEREGYRQMEQDYEKYITEQYESAMSYNDIGEGI